MEIFKQVKGYEGLYELSNKGRLKRLECVVSVNGQNDRHIKEHFVVGCKAGSGYRKVGLCKDGVVTSYYLHRLVYETFIGSIPSGYEVNHKDEDKTNNSISNLELVSHKENCNYGTRNQKESERKKQRCMEDIEYRERLTNQLSVNWEKNKRKVYQYTKDGQLVKEWDSIIEAANKLGLNSPNIIACCNNRQKTCGGYGWKY